MLLTVKTAELVIKLFVTS